MQFSRKIVEILRDPAFRLIERERGMRSHNPSYIRINFVRTKTIVLLQKIKRKEDFPNFRVTDRKVEQIRRRRRKIINKQVIKKKFK